MVTDSTATLPGSRVEEHGITVVPLQVVIAGHSYDDGIDPRASAEEVAAALRDFRPVSTSRPSPSVMADLYRKLAVDGAEEIVSVHVSSQVSGTYDSAVIAAEESPVPVHAVDSCQIGAGTGYAALAAALAATTGADGAAAAEAARRRARATTSLFYVATLEYLRRGGRVGAAAALLGSALAVKPILTINQGRVSPLEKVRTAGRAVARLEELAVASAGERPAAVTVSHLAAHDQALALAERLQHRLGDQVEDGEVRVHQVPAVLGAHVGPGLLGVTVSPG